MRIVYRVGNNEQVLKQCFGYCNKGALKESMQDYLSENLFRVRGFHRRVDP